MPPPNFEFDSKGNLHPYKIVEISFEDFHDFFVRNFQTSLTRVKLYHNFLSYLGEIFPLLENDFSIWVDGSFISQEENPNDIDLVAIIDFRDYDLNKSIFDDKFVPANIRKTLGVDAYIVRKYPKSHSKYIFTESDLLYWRDLFGRTKANRAKKQFPKGIIQLNFESWDKK